MHRLILLEINGFSGALTDTGPAFDTILGPNGARLISLHHIDFARADIRTVAATMTLLRIDARIHFKLQIPNDKSQIGSRHPCQINEPVLFGVSDFEN
jgi:hypothetical protein